MYDSLQYAEIKGKVECLNGTAVTGGDVFRCKNVSSPKACLFATEY
jgi:hypothetical protein